MSENKCPHCGGDTPVMECLNCKHFKYVQDNYLRNYSVCFLTKSFGPTIGMNGCKWESISEYGLPSTS